MFKDVVQKMKVLSSLLAALVVVGCASNPNKAEKMETKIEKSEEVGAGRSLGINKDKEMVTQKKVKLSEYLRTLQYDVYNLEKSIYGDDETGNKGKWGVLEDCRMGLNSAQNGGDGSYFKMPEKVRLTSGDGQVQKMGLDENNQLVGLSEDYLKNRIQKFENFKSTYESRKDWYDTQVKICKMATDKRAYQAAVAQQAVAYPEVKKTEPLEMDVQLCKYVRRGASLKEIVMLAMDKSWISKEDFQPNNIVNVGAATDATGFERNNVLKLGDWRLAYTARAELGELMNQGIDPTLEAWMNEDSSQLPEKSQCLPKKNRWWNTDRK